MSFARKNRNIRRRRTWRLTKSIRALISCNEASAVNRSNLSDDDVSKPSFCEQYASRFTSILETALFPFATYVQHMQEKFVADRQERMRDILPIPLLVDWPSNIDLHGLCLEAVLKITNICLHGLNFLVSGCSSKSSHVFCHQRPTQAQREVHRHVAARTTRYMKRLEACAYDGFLFDGCFDHFEDSLASPYYPIDCQRIDKPDVAATCESLDFVSPSLLDKLRKPENIFGPGPYTAFKVPAYSGGPRREYVKLSAALLQCGKLRLRREVHGGGATFAVKKSTPGHFREIWNGKSLSDSSMAPPKPHRLGNPTCFLDVVAEPGEHILYSKRDAQNYFDILRAPAPLTAWFGRPPVGVAELLDALCCDLGGLSSFLDDDSGEPLKPEDILYPISVVWPQGFSWSPAVAQNVTLSTCLEAGLMEEHVLSMDHPPPASQHELATVCTDDVVLLHRCVEYAQERLTRLDQAFARNQIPLNPSKSINCASELTALGCDLSNDPPLVEPAVDKLFQLVCAWLDVLKVCRASPKALNGSVGVAQWFCLLQRPLLSVLDEVYSFARLEPSQFVRYVPRGVLSEVALLLALFPLLPAQLDRPYLDLLTSCDASPAFGYGVSACQCSKELSMELGRYAEKRGDFIRFSRDDNDNEPARPRSGRERVLNIPKSKFKDVLSLRARMKAHSSVMEASGVVLLLRWLTRTWKRHHHRVVVLLDARAVLGAFAKGRSSSRALRFSTRASAAYILAANLMVRYLYVPSEDNPSDGASRGHRRRPRVRRALVKERRPKRLSRLDEYLESIQHLMDSGLLPDVMSSSSFSQETCSDDCPHSGFYFNS